MLKLNRNGKVFAMHAKYTSYTHTHTFIQTSHLA